MTDARKLATYEDVLSAPEHFIAEVIRGSLSLTPRPRFAHSRTMSRLGMQLRSFDDPGPSDPGGWIILVEPELHLGMEILVPDLAGWRRERMPEMPQVAYETLAPDWCCEILSPGTEKVDRGEKAEIYAEHGVSHYWLVNPELQTIEVLRLDGPTYRIVKVVRGEAPQRIEPFDAIEFPVTSLWAR